MLRIRLTRMGRRHRPFYRIVVVESSKKRDGEYIEALGWYDPLATKGHKIKLNKERYDYWLSVGAQTSDAVLKLILPVEEKKKRWPDKPKKKEAQAESQEEAQETANNDQGNSEKQADAETN